jgi:hypothetical protein
MKCLFRSTVLVVLLAGVALVGVGSDVVAGVAVAPRVVSASSASGNAVITIADMSPDTGVYAVQWVPLGQDFNSYQMHRTTSKTMNVPYLAFSRSYTLRVFVMAANWLLDDGHQTQNVTPHSQTFDLTMPACGDTATNAASVTSTTVALTCATGGTCAVGDTGPGGGIVFYVSAANFTSTGSDCNTTCNYLEAAPNGWGASSTADNACATPGTASADPACVWSGVTGTLIGATAQGTAVGTGYANTQAAVGQAVGGDTAGRAITAAWDYTNNGKSDWHLPSKDELNELCKYARTQTTGTTATVCANSGTLRTGFASANYWSSSELDATDAWYQAFSIGDQNFARKATNRRVRPVRAFG